MKMISRRSFLKAAGVASLGAAMVACGGSSSSTPASTAGSTASSTSAVEDPTKVTIQLGPNPETVDPALNSAIDGANYILFCFEGLLTVDPRKDNSLQPGQAESYTVRADGLAWTFTLRDGLKWRDGSDLAANDFVCAIPFWPLPTARPFWAWWKATTRLLPAIWMR